MASLTTPVRADREPDRRDEVSMRLQAGGVAGRLADRFVTLVCGLAPSDQRPLMVWTRHTFYAAVLLWLLGGTAGSALIMLYLPIWAWPLLAITLFITTAGARAGMLTIMHDAIHMSVEHKRPAVRWFFDAIGHLMSTALFVIGQTPYREGHVGKRGHHNARIFATLDDEDVRFIWSLGFKPGMSERELWRRFRKLRWHPWYHWTYLKARFESQILQGAWARRLAVAAFWLVLFGLAAANGWLIVLLVAWVLPVTVLFQRVALEQFLGEHRWLGGHAPDAPTRNLPVKLSAGRFALDAPPTPSASRIRSTLAWIAWWIKLLTVHVRFRALVVWGDLAHHDEHHAHGLMKIYRRGHRLPRWAQPEIAWMNMAYGRRLYEEYKRPEDPELNAFWNAPDPIAATFAMLSSLNPDEVGEPDFDGLGPGMIVM